MVNNAVIRNPKNSMQVIGCKAGTEELVINGCDVTSIAEEAFAGKKELRSVKIRAFRLREHKPRYIEAIGRAAFAGCSNLSHVELESDVAVLEERLFEGTTQRKVHIPESVALVGKRAFADCALLETVSGCEGLSVVQKEAFSGCASLKRIELPAVRQIQDGAFAGCGALESIRIGKDIKVLSDTFYGCPNLKRIHFEGSPEAWDALTGGTLASVPEDAMIYCEDNAGHPFHTQFFNEDLCYNAKDGRRVDKVNVYKGGALEIPEGVVSTAPNFCAGREVLSVTFPDGFESLGYGAFAHCKLDEVVLPSSLKYIGEAVFEGNARRIRVFYRGTKAQFLRIRKNGQDWLDGTERPVLVRCTDGKLYYKPRPYL